MYRFETRVCDICGHGETIAIEDNQPPRSEYELPSHEYYFDDDAADQDPDYDSNVGMRVTVTHRPFRNVCSGCQEAIAMTIDLRRTLADRRHEVGEHGNQQANG